MKAGFATSIFAHAALLAGAMVSLAAPPPLEVPSVDAVTVDIVPFEDITLTVEGEKEADVKTPPAPKETVEPPTVEEAVNVGETEQDIKVEAEEKAPEPPVEKAEVPTPESRPEPSPEPVAVPTPELAQKPEPKKDIALLLKENQQPEPKPEPTVSPAPKPEPAPESKPEPVEDAQEQIVKLPENVARPKARPTRKPVRAKTSDRKKKDNDKAKADKRDEIKDAIKQAVVNREKPRAGGAKRSKKKAGLGAKKGNNASRLTQSEIDAVRGRLEGCWSVGDLTGHPDAATMRAKVTFNLTKAGEIDGRVRVKVSGTDRRMRATLAVRVKSAIQECQPYKLPLDKYDNWSTVVVNFSLQDML